MSSEQDIQGAGPAGPGAVAPRVIGVVGAGTMGSGIAQLACRSGAATLLCDPAAEALQSGLEKVRRGLAIEASKGRISEEEAHAASERLRPAAGLTALSECELVIEAAPERPELKREIFRQLSKVVPEECVLATNTSSLPVTEVAAAATAPERVVGMHFFNPAPLMRLLEVIAGVRSSDRAMLLATAAGKAMGKTVIRANDGPGFLVNRCNRPFGLEALKLLSERVANLETIDRICRLGGGFKMGPFELSDLVGVDTGFDVSVSFYELSYGESRWRPSPLQARQVAAGLTGRKAGRGWYDYASDPYRPADPGPPSPTTGAQVEGDGPLAGALKALAESAQGQAVAGPGDTAIRRDGQPAVGSGKAQSPLDQTREPEISVSGLGGSVAGEPFYALVPLNLVEVTGEAGEQCFRGLGLHTARVQPSPGGVLPRMVCQLANECAFALGEGVGSAEDIDRGMVLGLNHPRGPLAWADEIGLHHVLATLLELSDFYRDERYRPAPTLRRLVDDGLLGKSTGAGFFQYR